MVDKNDMFPPVKPVVSISTLQPSVTSRLKTILLLVVSISPEVVKDPVLVEPKITVPPAVMSPAAAMVVLPVELMSTFPVTVTGLLTAIVETAL